MTFNDLHLSFYLPKEKQFQEYFLQQGLAFISQLREKLISIKESPKQKFKIILSTEEDNGEYTGSVNIRLHTIRPGEIWLLDDLEEYKMNGLLVMEA